MNLQQAYEGWSRQQQNRALYQKTRGAFSRSWAMLDMRKPCSEYNKQMLGEALAATRVIESDKVNAASVMVHVLTWANFAEPKYNPKPDFTFSDLMEYTKGPLADPEKIKPSDPVADLPKQQMAKENEEATLKQDEQPTDEPADETPKADEKKGNVPEPKPVVKIDPNTLKVVERYDSISQAQNRCHVSNITRVLVSHGICGGFYWAYASEAENFKPAEAKRGGRKKLTEAKTPAKKDDKQETATIPAEEAQEHAIAVKDSEPDFSAVTDKQLIVELKRRGWQGNLSLTLNVSL